MTESVAEFAIAASTWEAVPWLVLSALAIAIGIAVLIDAVTRP